MDRSQFSIVDFPWHFPLLGRGGDIRFRNSFTLALAGIYGGPWIATMEESRA
jgi:hypothetical protein